mmetsp:Transcript_14288/g.42002  ORF Transcript_14288/g.42002 Transcript_14288/m.42002 type:complete len:255 (-) Transcript_14288:203-967(-)
MLSPMCWPLSKGVRVKYSSLEQGVRRRSTVAMARGSVLVSTLSCARGSTMPLAVRTTEFCHLFVTRLLRRSCVVSPRERRRAGTPEALLLRRTAGPSEPGSPRRSGSVAPPEPTAESTSESVSACWRDGRTMGSRIVLLAGRRRRGGCGGAAPLPAPSAEPLCRSSWLRLKSSKGDCGEPEAKPGDMERRCAAPASSSAPLSFRADCGNPDAPRLPPPRRPPAAKSPPRDDTSPEEPPRIICLTPSTNISMLRE